ncbi:SPOR domain-containing protein [sulfur-oxidizing endosymbiont of Gigantopelta aegis]|uniref:SPOR domain-containing protein n=1 Tax=sulfur-oxidizing endosymbiont of Gigantopelta aegis TaxID=2794934 RepID=UPI0018DC3F6A|nr:SPOR domain-containing protein [sulfur-oxidizing endosymbiont of Gigantopelta aegis]
MPQLDRLGLRENPFKKNTDQRYFYADKSRAQILESTEHLIEYSSNFQVIIGAQGVGKSQLMEAIANKIDNNWRIAKVNNADQYDTLSLIQAILDAFGAVDNNHSELLEVLEAQLAEINQLGFKPVLLLDSAQALSIDSLRFLIQLSQQKQDDEPYINIVLFATEDVTDSLQSSELRDFRENIHIATLLAFDKEGVSGYLRHKMAVAGFDRESPFTPRIIDSIFNDSLGLPEKINLFADKFLTSSGKAENYILDTDSSSTAVETQQSEAEAPFELDIDEAMAELSDDLGTTDLGTIDLGTTDLGTTELDPIELENQFDSDNEADFSQQLDDLGLSNPSEANNDNLMDSFADDEFQGHRSDRAEEQLSRLAEKFEEIEQLDEQSNDNFLNDLDDNKHQIDSQSIEEPPSSGLPKFIIPIAVIGLLIVAVLVINSVFKDTGEMDSLADKQEKIELLPLELPPQQGDLISKEEKAVNEIKTPAIQPGPMVAEVDNKPELESKSELLVVEAAVEKIPTSSDTVVPPATNADEKMLTTPITAPITAPAVAAKEEQATAIITAKVTQVEPEPLIGSNSRQYLTIKGTQFTPDTLLVVTWGSNKKDFSAQLTPKQWQYINQTTIKLHLSTGIEEQQWQVSARNTAGAESPAVSFDVVRPYISKNALERVSPNPLKGSNKRQKIAIMGQGLTKQTVFEVKWAKNNKQFSSRLTPSQFEFVNSQQINLFLTTGTKERTWSVSFVGKGTKNSKVEFQVVKKLPAKALAAKALAVKDKPIVKAKFKDINWLKQQADEHYTLQLFGSYNKQAIDELVSKHALQGDMLRFASQRDGKTWYTLTYGNYASKQDATQAITGLAPELAQPAPWIRSMASIKESLQLKSLSVKSVAAKSEPVKSTPVKPAIVKSKAKDEAWIWTQNPAEYTVQLIALSSEQAIKDYIRKTGIQSEAVYFKTIRNKKALYVLLYGHYLDKQSADQAAGKLTTKISGSKPWVRSFSTVHEMMDNR